MAKEAKKYFEVNPWKVIENGFDPKQGRVSESIFSLGNEYMGIRGQFDETYSGDKLIGSYFNGIFEDKPLSYPEYFKGFAKRCCFMINANNWLYTRIFVDGTELDLAKVAFKDFYRELDMKTGIVTRSFTALGVKFTFERFVCIADHHIGGQKITFESQASHQIDFGDRFYACPRRRREKLLARSRKRRKLYRGENAFERTADFFKIQNERFGE